MKLLEIIIPYPVFLLGALIWAVLAFLPLLLLCNAFVVGKFYSRAIRSHHGLEPRTVYGLSQDAMSILFTSLAMLIWMFLYLCLFLYLSAGWIKAKSTDGWQERIKTIDTAIILGFGFEKNDRGQILPGEANDFLLQWTLDHTNADTLLVQEGVWTAACESKETQCEKSGRRLIRIHRHDKDVDVNTFQAAYCALEKMSQLGKKSAVLVAHDLQLERAVWDFDKLKQSRKNWSDFTFVVPEIPQTPFPENSGQWRTRSKLVYTFIELFGSRMRDYLSSTPENCIAPL